MAAYVKISTLGPRPIQDDDPPEGQAAVDRMIDFWRGKLDQVLCDRPDLIVLPEACDRYPGHTKQQRIEYYLTRGDQVRDFLGGVARERGCNIAYSAARQLQDGGWANSTQIISRDGEVIGTYNKNHTTIEETRESGMRIGSEAPIIECDFGRVACAICFDLNFDHIRRQYVEARPDVIVFSSMYHGGLMQAYWAYSCRAHFVGAVPGLPCTVISPVGEMIAASTNYYDYATATVNLDCRVVHLDDNRPRFEAMRARYGPKVKVSDPGYLAAVMISSETDEFTIDRIVEEFEIELLDDYLERSLAMHRDRTLWV